MKKNLWLACGLVLCGSVMAQQTADSPPSVASAGALETTNAPAGNPAAGGLANPARAARSSAAAAFKTTPLVPGPAKVVARNVNIRGQPKLLSEVITRLNWGDEVMVLDEITNEDSAPDEPSAWAKILLPTNTHVWVHSMFVDDATRTVTANLLNLRGGPGENYSILGRIPRGYLIHELGVKGDWLQIEAPTNAYAFMAAQYLEQPGQAPMVAETTTQATTQPPAEETTTVPATTTAEVPPPTTTNVIAETAPVIPATVDKLPTTPATNVSEVATTPGATTSTTNAATSEPVPEEQPEEPPQPRIVQREGVVRGTLSIQAPTRFELFSPESGRVINYLYTTARDLDLGRYKGLRIIVTGEEGLDERWRNTPILTIQRIQVLE